MEFKAMASKGIVTNVSKNPVELPDGSTLAPGETRQDFDEATLKDNLFLNGGWLVVGKDAKALQDQLDSSDETVKELQAKLDELQTAVSDLTLRATTAEAKAAAVDPDQVKNLQDQLDVQTKRAVDAEAQVVELQKPKK